MPSPPLRATAARGAGAGGKLARQRHGCGTGRGPLDEWITYTNEYGVHEYDSTFYYWNDLNGLFPAVAYAPSHALRAKFTAVADFLFADMAANYFVPSKTLAGPHSRDYNFLTGRFYMVRSVWGSGILAVTATYLDGAEARGRAAKQEIMRGWSS